MMRYTKEQIDFIRVNYGKAIYAEIANLFNKRFNTSCSILAIMKAAIHHGIAAKKQIIPVGAEKKDNRGYTVVKVSEHGKRCWEYKHRLIWEQANGPMPEGYRFLFLDKDKSNLSLSNLAIATGAEIIYMKRNNLIFNDAEKTRAGLCIAQLNNAIHKRLFHHLGEIEYERYMHRKERKKGSKRYVQKTGKNKLPLKKEDAHNQEYMEFLQNIADIKMKEAMPVFNDHFGTDFNERQMYKLFRRFSIPKRQKKCVFRGVLKKMNKWEARIIFHGEYIFLGMHNTAEEAVAARMKKEQELYPMGYRPKMERKTKIGGDHNGKDTEH